MAYFQEAITFQPEFVEAHINLANLLYLKGQVNEAVAHFQKALAIRPDHAEAHNNFGYVLQRMGQAKEAVRHYQESLKIRPDYAEAQNNLAWLLATCPEVSVRNGSQALALAQQADRLSGGNNPVMIKTLAAANAEAGRFPEALAAAKRALELAAAANNGALTSDLRAQIELYQTGSPFRDTAQTSH